MEDFTLLVQVCDILKSGIIVVDNRGTVYAINDMARDVFWKGPDSPLGVAARDLAGDPLLMEALCSGMANPGHFLAVNKKIYLVASFNIRKQKERGFFVFIFRIQRNSGWILKLALNNIALLCSPLARSSTV